MQTEQILTLQMVALSFNIINCMKIKNIASVSKLITFVLVVLVSISAGAELVSGQTPQPENKIVTLADNGGTINLSVNETFLLKLGEDYEWNITIDDMTVISRVPNVLVVRGAEGLYRAHKPGHTNLTAAGDPVCRKNQPPCEAPTLLFHIGVNVAGPPTTPASGIISAVFAIIVAQWLRKN